MDYIIHNPDILTEWRMSEQYRMEEEWAIMQMDMQEPYLRDYERYLKLKKIKKFKALNITVRIPIKVVELDDDDIPF